MSTASSTASGITDIAGIRVGNVEQAGHGYLTGTTVVLPPSGTVGAVAVAGGGPGTHETDALAPGTLTSTVHAVVLTGGSAYGLVTAHGVQRWCEDNGRGLEVNAAGQVVPIVPGAVIFDLGRGGDFHARPNQDWGYQAAQRANATTEHAPLSRGNAGAGCGAVTADGRLKGGLGSAAVSIQLDGFDATVGALAVVNSRGVPQLPGITDRLAQLPAPSGPAQGQQGDSTGDNQQTGDHGLHTTLAVVATDAALDVAQARRMADCGHDGLARAINPVHTLTDGDTVFALATGDRALPGKTPNTALTALAAVQQAAAEAVELSIQDAVHTATAVDTEQDHFPSFSAPT